MMIRTIDLFAGCGGLTDGFKQTGEFQTVACVEWERPPCETLQRRLELKWGYTNPHEVVIQFDIQRTEVLFRGWNDDERYLSHPGLDALVETSGGIDAVIGGPPCQAYSVAGRVRDENRMNYDYRNYLFESYLRVVSRYQPRLVVFENVPGILSAMPNGVSIIERITREFSNVGYSISSNLRKNALINSSEFDVPQSRRRVIIVGVRHDGFRTNASQIIEDFYQNLLPKHRSSEKSTVGEAILDLPKLYPLPEPRNINGKVRSHQLVDCEITNHEPRTHNVRDVAIFRQLAEDIESGTMRYSTAQSLKDLYYERTGRRSNIHKYYVLRRDQPSNTIPAHLYKDGLRHIHPDSTQARTITVREAARLQSFDDDFEFLGSMTDQFKMIGNAVPPRLARAVGLAVCEIFEKYEQLSRSDSK